MEIIDNPDIHFKNLKQPKHIYDAEKEQYHTYFAYVIDDVTGFTDLKVVVSDGEKPVSVTVEHCTHPEMIGEGNVYVIHIVLTKYYYSGKKPCNRTITVTGTFLIKDSKKGKPIKIKMLQTGCSKEEPAGDFNSDFNRDFYVLDYW